MDLDARIKILFKGKNSEKFCQLLGFSSDDGETENHDHTHSPRKHPSSLFRFRSSAMWNSDSEEETVETAFAKKFKRNTFVPVDEEGSSKSDNQYDWFNGDSPPPSPFLAIHTNKTRTSHRVGNNFFMIPPSAHSVRFTVKKAIFHVNKIVLILQRLEFEADLDQISDDSSDMPPVSKSRSKSKRERTDDMSLSPLSPEDPSNIRLPPMPPLPPEPEKESTPPLPAYPPPGQFIHPFDPAYPFPPYMFPWNSNSAQPMHMHPTASMPMFIPPGQLYPEEAPPPPPEPMNGQMKEPEPITPASAIK